MSYPLDFSRQIDDAVQRLLAHAGAALTVLPGLSTALPGALRA